MRESDLQVQVADYLRLQYPNVIFRSDFGAGIKLTIGQATKQARQNGCIKGYPDMFVAEPMVDPDDDERVICGLFLELKVKSTRLKKKNGEWASEHIAEQAEMLDKLNRRGYFAAFAVGFEEAKEIIDSYLSSGRYV